MNSSLRRITRWKLFRFGLVGLCAALTDLLLFWFLNQRLGWHRLLSQSLSRPAGGLVSFGLNKIWTFGNKDVHTIHRQALRYAVIWGVGFLASSVLIEVYRHALPPPDRYDFLAKALAEGTLGLLSFLAQRYWAFRPIPGTSRS